MGLFPQQFIDDLRSQANILHIVQEYVPLKRALAGFLQQHPLVARFATAPPEQGGGGVTVVELKD